MSVAKFIADLKGFDNEEANEHMDKLLRACWYKAPESRPYFFWNGDGKRWGVVDICQEFFPEDDQVLELFNAARKAADDGVFQY